MTFFVGLGLLIAVAVALADPNEGPYLEPENRAQVLTNVLSIIKADLDIDANEDTLVKDLGDCLVVAELLMNIEDGFAVEFKPTKGLNTVNDLVSRIAKELKLSS